MDSNFGSRYTMNGAVKELTYGRLHEADDQALSRRVYLYELRGGQTGPERRDALLRGASFNHDAFMHILDVGFVGNSSFAVFKADGGAPLLEVLRRHGLDAEDVVKQVYELGLAMLEAAEEGVFGYGVLADNIWLGSGGRLMPIHYWEPGEERAKGAAGLCGLLRQLLLKDAAAANWRTVSEPRLRIALHRLQLDRMEALLSVMDRVHREKLALANFLVLLQGCLPDTAPKEELAAQPPIEDHAAAQPDVLPSLSARPFAEPVRPTQSEPGEDTSVLRPPALPVVRVASHIPGEPEVKDEDARDDEPSGEEEEPRRPLWLRLTVVAGAACIFVVVFIGCLAMFFSSGGERADTASAPSSGEPAAQASPPTAAAAPVRQEAAPTQPPKTSEPNPAPNQPAANNGPTSVPKLIGLTRAEAEKTALAAGLRYSFSIIHSDAPQGTVFEQEPAAGTAAARGDSVKFSVSRGSQ
ncbi:PASTA domain-containing protein [Paenibacillus chartarius]|uniref:PASTA domain-containing protein n=1 Tax=Paenibacillus chartarius TaxID=747481 RepID=A0ABV6DQN3_9BACL